jgi:hypothetical protein
MDEFGLSTNWIFLFALFEENTSVDRISTVRGRCALILPPEYNIDASDKAAHGSLSLLVFVSACVSGGFLFCISGAMYEHDKLCQAIILPLRQI